MTRFGCPVELVSDRGTRFLNEVIEELTKTHMILHKKSTPYHPQANGQIESSNKILVKILKKIVQEDHKDWDLKLDSALWSFKTAFKVTTRMTPFKIVYGLEVVVPMEFLVPSLRVSTEKMSPALSVKHRCKYLMQLEEDRLVLAIMVELVQEVATFVVAVAVVVVVSRSAQVVLVALVWVVGRVVVVFLLVVTLVVCVLYSFHSSLGGGKSTFDVSPRCNYSSGNLEVSFFDLFHARVVMGL
ncbi:hypothetical protein L7F22_010646 [Adiantum nelumboides]|nr:hypothetical protein [Adiantum nelumboides]